MSTRILFNDSVKILEETTLQENSYISITTSRESIQIFQQDPESLLTNKSYRRTHCYVPLNNKFIDLYQVQEEEILKSLPLYWLNEYYYIQECIKVDNYTGEDF